MPNKTKSDLLAGCLDDLRSKTDNPVSADDVEETFCNRCRNQDCVRAGQGQTKWLHRMETQYDRLFHSPVADPDSPLARELAQQEFKDMTQKAMRIIVNAQKGDWSVPTEEEILRAQGVNQMPRGFQEGEEAAKAASKGSTEIVLPDNDPPEPEPEGEDVDPYDFSDPSDTDEEPGRTFQPGPKVQEGFTKPKTANVDKRSGIMIGGSTPSEPDAQEPDPWAPPPKRKKKKVTKIEPGGTFTFSASLHDKDEGQGDG